MPYFLVLLIFTITSCSSKKELPPTFEEKPIYYSYPDQQDSEDIPQHLKKIILIGTNDFHGNLQISMEKTKEKEGKSSQLIPVGGAGIISSYFKILRKKYANNLLFLDAGDLYQGTMISNTFKGEPVVKFYNYLNYDALTLGNHEFDYGPETLTHFIAKKNEDRVGAIKKIVRESKVPFINSNIVELQSYEPLDWPGLKQTHLVDVNGVKVGIIGAATTETPSKTIKDHVQGLYFLDLTSTVLKYSKILKNKGAQVIILVTHAGTYCDGNSSVLESTNFDPSINPCDQNGELSVMLSKIPKGTLDAVVAGHTHTKIANFIEGVPVIESFFYGKYFGRVDLYYNKETQSLETSKTKIYQPTKFCHFFFEESKNCHPFDPNINHELQIPATFLGEKIEVDQKANELISTYEAKIDKKQKQFVAKIKSTIGFSKTEESGLGKLVADSMRYAMNTPIAITNSGGIRTSVESGDLTYGGTFKVLPFDNFLMTLKVTGAQLKNIIKIGTSKSSVGQISVSGLKIILDKTNFKNNDLNNDGKIEDYERDYTLEIKLENNGPIENEKEYIVATNSFLGEIGGDFFDTITKNIEPKNKSVNYTLTYRDGFIEYLMMLNKKFGEVDINTLKEFKIHEPRFINK